MSFLNPVNEPVLRFKSTDAGAPQINYNSRVAGDVKAVLKACLVTGYGATASAGWSVVNEVNHVAEFVSPSAAMSDYRLGIDDTSTSSTTWYYQYQDARVTPEKNNPKKSLSNINKTSPSNGWQLLVTDLGICFIEIVYNTLVNDKFGRITYWGQVKSALTNDNGKNMTFWNVGYGSPITVPYDFFRDAYSANRHHIIGNYNGARIAGANTNAFIASSNVFANTTVDMVSALYLYDGPLLIAQQPAIMTKNISSLSSLYGVEDTTFGNRPALKVCMCFDSASVSDLESFSKVLLVPLDYWEY